MPVLPAPVPFTGNKRSRSRFPNHRRLYHRKQRLFIPERVSRHLRIIRAWLHLLRSARLRRHLPPRPSPLNRLPLLRSSRSWFRSKRRLHRQHPLFQVLGKIRRYRYPRTPRQARVLRILHPLRPFRNIDPRLFRNHRFPPRHPVRHFHRCHRLPPHRSNPRPNTRPFLILKHRFRCRRECRHHPPPLRRILAPTPSDNILYREHRPIIRHKNPLPFSRLSRFPNNKHRLLLRPIRLHELPPA